MSLKDFLLHVALAAMNETFLYNFVEIGPEVSGSCHLKKLLMTDDARWTHGDHNSSP